MKYHEPRMSGLFSAIFCSLSTGFKSWALFLLALFTYLIFYNVYWKRKNLPPGPIPLPFIGNLLSFSTKVAPYEKLLKWHNLYGPLVTIWMGEKPIVSVTNLELLKETFVQNGDSYYGRTGRNWNKLMRGGIEGGIVFIEGDLWKEQRRFLVHVLRNFGVGRNIIEKMIMKEVERLISHVDNKLHSGEKITNLHDIMDVCIGSIINTLLFGYRFIGDTEKEFYELKRMMDDQMQLSGDPMVLLIAVFPNILKSLPFFNKLYARMMRNVENLFKFFDRQIDEHHKQFSLGGNSETTKNFVHAFLNEANRRKKMGNSGNFTNHQLRNICFDIWIAGQETTSSTVKFGILYLTNHPKFQRKMQKELDAIVGQERRVTLADRPKLTYVNAVINETQRLCNLLPINIMHRTTKTVSIKGYEIKEGTSIVPQISCLLYDEKVFPNPKEFNPDRFINKNGKLKKFEQFIPFSIGKRQCLGESLARDELFLFLSNLFHHFEVRFDNPPDPTILEPINGLIVSPKQFNVTIKRRISFIEESRDF